MSDRVRATSLEAGKEVYMSATVSSLCTIQHSPSARADFAPKLTVTCTDAKTGSYGSPSA